MRLRWTNERVTPPRVVAGGTLLDPDALTIGFARRFTGYKRPELVFHDPQRLARILNALRRPVQLVFAGKAHPADDSGKHALQGVYRRAIDPTFGGRVAFVDDYDLHVAHFLVQGCDVWLNNPRKPLEASGTSGMKASCNGTLHLSIGDGWWAEGYNGEEWVAHRPRGPARRPGGAGCRRRRRAVSRCSRPRSSRCSTTGDEQDVPRRWVARVKEAVRSVAPQLQHAAHGEGVRRTDVRAGPAAGDRRGAEVATSRCRGPARPGHCLSRRLRQDYNPG